MVRRKRRRRRGRLRRSGRMVRVFLTTSPPPLTRYLPRPGEHTHSRKKVVFFSRRKKVFLLLLLRCFHLCYTLFYKLSREKEEGEKPESLYFLMRRTSFSPINFFSVCDICEILSPPRIRCLTLISPRLTFLLNLEPPFCGGKEEEGEQSGGMRKGGGGGSRDFLFFFFFFCEKYLFPLLPFQALAMTCLSRRREAEKKSRIYQIFQKIYLQPLQL